MKRVTASAALALAMVTTPVHAHDIIRHASPNLPVATSVLVPSGVDLVFVSGMLPDAANPSAPAGSPQRFGDTATQTRSVLGKIAAELMSYDLTMADVVKMNVYLVGDPQKKGDVDYQGLMQAYMGLYGIRVLEKHLPARTTVQVAGLPVPGVLVEIEVTAARHPTD